VGGIHKVQSASRFNVPDEIYAPTLRRVTVQVHHDVYRGRARRRPPLQQKVGWRALMRCEQGKARHDQPAGVNRFSPQPRREVAIERQRRFGPMPEARLLALIAYRCRECRHV
jgi:hypothetical protein